MVVVVVMVHRWHTIRGSNAYIQEVTNDKLTLTQALGVIRSFLASARNPDLSHMVAIPVHGHQGKVKVGASPPGVRINVPDKGGQFSESGILPCVDLQFVRGYFSVLVLLQGVMPAGVAKDPKQQWTGLEIDD